MKLLPITTGEFALVDDEDFEHLSNDRWVLLGVNKCVYRFFKENHKSYGVPLTNDIMNDYRSVYDHRDRNTLNNQKTNIRLCTHSQNMANRGKINNGSISNFKGVTFHTPNGKWRARISKNNKIISLGIYFTEIEAALAYDSAAIKLHGEFACLNFPIQSTK